MFNPQPVEASDDADDVDNGVERADLVKMNLPRVHAVHRSFGISQTPKDGQGTAAHVGRERARHEDRLDIGKVAVVGLGRDIYARLRPSNAVAYSSLGA